MKKRLCMQRGTTTERVQVSTDKSDIVLLSGDRVVYIPISPGYYARSGRSGGRIMVNGNRLCKNAVFMREYRKVLSDRYITEWIAPYDGIYKIVIHGAGGGGEGGIEEETEYEESESYTWYDGESGHSGEEIIINKEYSAGERVWVNIGRGGANGDWLFKRDYDHKKKTEINFGRDGGDTTFDGIRALGGTGGGKPKKSEATNEHGSPGGYTWHNPRYAEKRQPNWIEHDGSDGLIMISLLAGG